MGFEVVVRPVVLPNIRPPIPRVLSSPDDPTKGLAVLSGGGGKFIGTSYSFSASTSKSKSHATETRRQVDVDRVYQMDNKGNVNKDNFIDVERTTRLKTDDGAGDGVLVNRYVGTGNIAYAEPEPRDNVEILERDKTIESP